MKIITLNNSCAEKFFKTIKEAGYMPKKSVISPEQRKKIIEHLKSVHGPDIAHKFEIGDISDKDVFKYIGNIEASSKIKIRKK